MRAALLGDKGRSELKVAGKTDDGEVGVASRWRLSDNAFWVARAASAAIASTEALLEVAWGAVGAKGGASVATGPFSDAMSLGNRESNERLNTLQDFTVDKREDDANGAVALQQGIAELDGDKAVWCGWRWWLSSQWPCCDGNRAVGE